ncbi:MAG: inositol monophosphatase [Gammaproteobacteria bacterium]|nr:inositol monophosphatase [Gammaproteobacteria bacterium]MCI0591497.1 inositol monophosphatase [Gammaproteobacteria bacterium]
MHPMLNIAIRAARAAGDIIVRHMDRVQGLEVSPKGYNDFVTEVDRMAEEAIIRRIHKAYPHHGIIAEESGQQGSDKYQWIIDPLDGTINYLHGFPQYAVSVALRHRGILEQGVVYDPLRQELFTATRGAGALMNDRRIRVSQQKRLEHALIGTGFPFKDQERLDIYLATFKALSPITSGIRRAGSAALDLAYIACGRLDGFWEFGLREWDMAAGVLLVQEAGGLVSDLNGDHDYLRTGNIAAGNPKIFKAMIRAIQPHLSGSFQQ